MEYAKLYILADDEKLISLNYNTDIQFFHDPNHATFEKQFERELILLLVHKIDLFNFLIVWRQFREWRDMRDADSFPMFL